MMNRVWKLGFAALGGAIVACSGGDSNGVAGSSMETENSIALSVQLADGSPAARVKVIVRPDSYFGRGRFRRRLSRRREHELRDGFYGQARS